MFFVFLFKSYNHKHKFLNFETEEELREYLHEYLTRHCKFSKYNPDYFSELEDIVREAIKVGYILQDEKRCYAVLKIIEGEDLFTVSNQSDSDSSSYSTSQYTEDEESSEEEDIEDSNEENEDEESSEEEDIEDSNEDEENEEVSNKESSKEKLSDSYFVELDEIA